ncbi:hypothetical protein DERP_006053 [Dermatophagoides pteronyssinus]|uniref:Uncharacterized protein n=1 Tax=Dermatophagoides pteronyssinus TaxID=6956 RepID=A0ABQ8JSN7_DERPT|nr:hypothetical protein DERP_006053 [Dermatophagoides pteronyssinus]
MIFYNNVKITIIILIVKSNEKNDYFGIDDLMDGWIDLLIDWNRDIYISSLLMYQKESRIMKLKKNGNSNTTDA